MKSAVLVDIEVVCDPPSSVGYWSSTVESRAKALEDWAKEFNAFIKDHRSQDGMTIRVERKFEERCSHCDDEWDIDGESGEPLCCTKAQEEWAAKVEAI